MMVVVLVVVGDDYSSCGCECVMVVVVGAVLVVWSQTTDILSVPTPI